MDTVNSIREKFSLDSKPAPREAHGGQATVYRSFRENFNRYKYDSRLCGRLDGWHQYDTSQDAWFHGVWYHPEAKVFVVYAEGDEYVTLCHTDEAWAAEVRRMGEVYGQPPPAAVGFDLDGTRTEFYSEDARPSVGEES